MSQMASSSRGSACRISIEGSGFHRLHHDQVHLTFEAAQFLGVNRNGAAFSIESEWLESRAEQAIDHGLTRQTTCAAQIRRILKEHCDGASKRLGCAGNDGWLITLHVDFENVHQPVGKPEPMESFIKVNDWHHT